MDASSADIIRFEDVTYRYNRKLALQSLNVAVPPGRTALLGRNGAGKSTFLELLATVRQPQQGNIVVAGLSVASETSKVRDRLGYLPQELQLPANYSVLDFMAYAAWMRRVPKISEAVRDALQLCDLHDKGAEKIGSLSGGMRQRLRIAQAIVHKPSLLIVDEPTVGLDVEQRVGLRKVFLSLNCSVILATHLVDDVARLADYAVILNNGKAVFAGLTSDLCAGQPVTAETLEAAYLDKLAAA